MTLIISIHFANKHNDPCIKTLRIVYWQPIVNLMNFRSVAILCCLVAVLAKANDPVILFHGMGDQCSNKGMGAFTTLIGQEL